MFEIDSGLFSEWTAKYFINKNIPLACSAANSPILSTSSPWYKANILKYPLIAKNVKQINNPSIYIFDDSFSALDFKTDKNLRHELKKITKESTVLIVAQRISTVLNADQIIVLDEGKIVGIGKHEELMKICEVYKEIALSQVTEEELNGK